MKLTLGSTSQMKREAVVSALAALGLEASLEIVAAASLVATQPVGREETTAGARNRARGARAQVPGTYAIGIENGLRQTAEGWVDWAVIIVICPDGTELMTESAAVSVPTEAVEMARQSEFHTTVGAILAAKYGSTPDDPHTFLTGHKVSRVGLLMEALMGLLGSLKATNEMESKMEKVTHTITVGSVTRELPLREVAPGVTVALFNPLGDWELTEAIGTELAALIPAGTEVLLMPDGKAQALLHVMGRISKLPTIVARKEHKPYMAEPVLEARVKSITTKREQVLYLGADDVARLKGKKVAIVDDVVSTGGTLKAVLLLLEQAGAELAAVMAAFTEGTPRQEVIALGHLPLF